MNKTVTWVIAAVILIALTVGAYFLVINQNNQPNSTQQASDDTVPTDSDAEETQPSDDETAATAQTIAYKNSGFSPATITVTSGQSIVVTNNAEQTLDFASDDHPTHRINSELNIGTIGPGTSKTFVLTQAGTFRYHDHLNPGLKGTIIVQ